MRDGSFGRLDPAVRWKAALAPCRPSSPPGADPDGGAVVLHLLRCVDPAALLFESEALGQANAAAAPVSRSDPVAALPTPASSL